MHVLILSQYYDPKPVLKHGSFRMRSTKAVTRSSATKRKSAMSVVALEARATRRTDRVFSIWRIPRRTLSPSCRTGASFAKSGRFFGIANATVRDVTVRPKTLRCGSNILSGSWPDLIVHSIALSMAKESSPPPESSALDVATTDAKIMLGHTSHRSDSGFGS